jgi:hypothetical protein
MTTPAGGPLPPIPATITIPTFKVSSLASGTITIPSALPFYYAGIQTMWLYWPVDLALLDRYLSPLGMTPVSFGGSGLVGINFFNAVAQYGVGFPGNQGGADFNETEVCIMASASAVASRVPADLTVAGFLTQGEQTKRAGAYRLWVACDSPVAIAAGIQLFFENKFLTAYSYNVPTLNNPGQTEHTWTCMDSENPSQEIYKATVSLAGLTPVPSNMSEWIDLSYVASAKRVAASRRNYFGMYDTYLLTPAQAPAVSVTMGTSTHQMRLDMETLIGTRPAVAIQTFRSQPCVAEASAYWADV